MPNKYKQTYEVHKTSNVPKLISSIKQSCEYCKPDKDIQ